jgi:uncharacterized protein (DUF924 family)
MTPVDEILEFWFGPELGRGAAAYQERWFRPDPAFDAEVTARFADLHQRAVAGELDHWGDEPRACLALVLALDQFPRNMFRASPRAFASDGQALAVARRAIARGLDRELPAAGRMFLYLPFQHSEALADQRRSVELSRAIDGDPGSGENLAYARRHLEVIERFGRFPHRNAVLGRPSTPEEEAFLKQPGSSFGGGGASAAGGEAGAEA